MRIVNLNDSNASCPFNEVIIFIKLKLKLKEGTLGLNKLFSAQSLNNNLYANENHSVYAVLVDEISNLVSRKWKTLFCFYSLDVPPEIDGIRFCIFDASARHTSIFVKRSLVVQLSPSFMVKYEKFTVNGKIGTLNDPS